MMKDVGIDMDIAIVKNGIVQTPFFVCCSGRSGSSHLSCMLNSHPEISCLDEVGFITDLVSDDGDIPDMDTYHEYLSTDRGFFSQKLALDKRLNFPALINNFLCQPKDARQMRSIGAIAHFDFVRLKRLWPNARFIHLTRDGRDVTYSWLKERNLDCSAWFAAERWQVAEQAWDTLARELADDDYLEITYEDFVSDVEGTLKQVCSFIDVPYDQEMMNFAQEGSYFQMPDPKFIGLWRHHLSPSEIRLAEARLSEQLTSRGYALSALPPLRVSALDKKLLKLGQIWHRQLSKLRFFGLKLYSLDLLARRIFKSVRLREAVKYEMNQMVDAHRLR